MAPKPTGALLRQLRALMVSAGQVGDALQAYIVPSNDAHNSEYLAEPDMRRAFISGFTGSAGTAIVTDAQALLWTDGRYFLQASQQLDENWTLMKEGVPSTPTQGQWLVKNLPPGARVGVDPKLYTNQMWTSLSSQLEAANQRLVPVAANLVDLVWPDRPPRPTRPVHPLALEFTGKPLREKLEGVRKQMAEKRAQHLVVSALDEVAWLLNLRGSDISYNPVFFSYVIVHGESFVVFLYPSQQTDEVKQHLAAESGGSSFEVRPYDSVEEYIRGMCGALEGAVWFPDSASHSLVSLVPARHVLAEITPVALMKAVKNPVEAEGMRRAHVKDAAALIAYFAWLEKSVQGGANITEVSGATKLEEFRSQQKDFMGLSFPTISSVGPHGAIIHYQPSTETDVPITVDTLYLCDSGGQYRDGTTDVTRTLHFGTPTDHEKECYTRVLKGQIKLATVVFPSKIKGNCLDSFAREFLWEVGLDYAHGTGHGIGSYLNVHEGPMGISWRPILDDPGLEPGMFISNEPGYYEDGKFGVRIEDIVLVVEADPPHNFNGRGFLTFETVTLVPKQPKLIRVQMLTDRELEFLNAYHRRCRDVMGPVLDRRGNREAKEWLWRETEPLSKSQ